jgi:hypothetical protein
VEQTQPSRSQRTNPQRVVFCCTIKRINLFDVVAYNDDDSIPSRAETSPSVNLMKITKESLQQKSLEYPTKNPSK